MHRTQEPDTYVSRHKKKQNSLLSNKKIFTYLVFNIISFCVI